MASESVGSQGTFDFSYLKFQFKMGDSPREMSASREQKQHIFVSLISGSFLSVKIEQVALNMGPGVGGRKGSRVSILGKHTFTSRRNRNKHISFFRFSSYIHGSCIGSEQNFLIAEIPKAVRWKTWAWVRRPT